MSGTGSVAGGGALNSNFMDELMSLKRSKSKGARTQNNDSSFSSKAAPQINKLHQKTRKEEEPLVEIGESKD